MRKERSIVYRPEDLPDCQLELTVLLGMAQECISGLGTETAVYSLQAGTGTYYLKVCHREKLRKLLPRLISSRKWCSSVELEAQVLLSLKGRGFNTIPVVASGSVYKAGFPEQGYMLTKAVVGDSLESLLSDNAVGSFGLWERYGELVARLHEAGCYEPLRAKDILVDNGVMLLLDREKPFRNKQKANTGRALKSLERAVYRNRRSGLKMAEAELKGFLRGYSSVRPDMTVCLEKALLANSGFGK